jgi:hypothetical protein
LQNVFGKNCLIFINITRVIALCSAIFVLTELFFGIWLTVINGILIPAPNDRVIEIPE